MLRLIEEIPYLKKETDSFIKSVTKLGPILVPIGFLLYFFCVFGLHLLSGLTEYRCRLTELPVDGIWLADLNEKNLCG
jgi:hypothetical protein